MKKKNGIRLTRRSKTYTKGLAYAITTYARVQMPPYYRRFAYRHKKMPGCGAIGQNSLSFGIY